MSHEVYNYGEGWAFLFIIIIIFLFGELVKKIRPSERVNELISLDFFFNIRVRTGFIFIGILTIFMKFRIFFVFFGRLVGKVAADNSHKWVFGDNPNENDPNFISSWNVSIYPVSKIKILPRIFLQHKIF